MRFLRILFFYVYATIYDRALRWATAIFLLLTGLAVNGDQSVGQLALDIPFEVVA
jgi:hypothetical protein